MVKLEQMASPSEDRSRGAKRDSYYGSKLVIVIFILSFSFIMITFASLETQSACFCGFTQVEELSITKVTFGSMPGQVTFGLQNSGPMDVTIIEVFQGLLYNPNATVYPAVYPNIVIHPVSNLTMTVTFTGVTFQAGTRYDFGMVSTRGSRFPTSGTP